MGINGLKSLIKKCAIPRKITHLRHKKIALDTSIFEYRFLYRSPTTEECTRFVIDGFLQQLRKFKRNNVIPIYVLDGKATQYKKALETRKKQRDKTTQRIQTFEEEIQQYESTIISIDQSIVDIDIKKTGNIDGTIIIKEHDVIGQSEGNVESNVGDVEANVDLPKSPKTQKLYYEIHKRELHTKIEERRESVHKLTKQTRKPTSENKVKIKKLFDLLNVPYIQSPEESDALFAYLMKNKKVDGVITEDTDMLPLACSSFICGFDNPRIQMSEYYLKDVLNTLEIDYKQFVDLCILCGCDYAEKISQIGPKRGLMLIKKYKTIENIIEKYIKSNDKLITKHPYPDDFLTQVKDARNMFHTAHNFDDMIVNNKEFSDKLETFEWNGLIEKEYDEQFCDFLEECGMDQIAQNNWIKVFSTSNDKVNAINAINNSKKNSVQIDSSQKTIFSFFKKIPKTPQNTSNTQNKD